MNGVVERARRENSRDVFVFGEGGEEALGQVGRREGTRGVVQEDFVRGVACQGFKSVADGLRAGRAADDGRAEAEARDSGRVCVFVAGGDDGADVGACEGGRGAASFQRGAQERASVGQLRVDFIGACRVKALS